ncbi:hypothetical protein KR018_002431 [Drosophila ironensis]|nr:hypothetical protein KR018_002431 [Drosophila ironensis]
MSNQLERLLFFIVVISGALCTVEDYVIMSLCAPNKAIHLAAEGTVSVTDTSQIQNITIVGFPDYLNQEFKFKLALYAKDTQRYLCFNDNWRLVGMRELRDTCYFNETIAHGYFVFRSIVDSQRRVGFTHVGKPVGPKMTNVKDACYYFNKIDAEQFYLHRSHFNNNGNGNGNGNGSGNGSSNGSGSSNIKSRKPPRNNKNNRHKSNNQNQKLQQQQEHHGHNNNNVILNNNSSNSLSRTNKKQQSKQQQRQQQHQVRHHHNDPSLLARRQQHEKKQKRRKQHKQQQQQLHQQHQQRVTASPTKPATATTPAAAATSPAAATATATTTTAATLSSKRKGRRRKGKSKLAKLQHQQPLLATSATTAYTDDSLYSSSSSSSSTGFEDLDPYNISSSSSSLEPWSTWSTIDSFSSSGSGSSTTATSDDSISSSSNYDAWATMITKMESEASDILPELNGNDTDLLLHYEPQLVEETGLPEEAESTATYETKATSAIAATAATTTSTTGQQLVIEQTPVQQEVARGSWRGSTLAATATATAATARARARATVTTAATPTATTSQTETIQSTQRQSRHKAQQENSKQNAVKPPQRQHKFLHSLQPATTTRLQQLSSTAETPSTASQQLTPSSLFSIYKNINGDLNNSLTEASPTATAATGATAPVTVATTSKKSLRKFTRKLMATPYHQLTYVRNEAGDIDIDNLDNISVYPDLFEGALEDNGNGNGNGSDSMDNIRQTPVSGYLPTSSTSVMTEFIRIGKSKIDRALKRSHMHGQRRFA